MKQGSQEWLVARLGSATASRFGDVLAKTRNGESASRKNYLYALVCERLTGVSQDSFESEAMRWGTEHEPYARMAFEDAHDTLVEECGFLAHPTIAYCGASPDGLLDDDGTLELKCPNTSQHVDALLNGMPAKHIPQIQGHLWITARQYAMFASFDPRLPPELRLYTQRIERGEAYIDSLEKEVVKFLAEVDATTESLRGLALRRAA